MRPARYQKCVNLAQSYNKFADPWSRALGKRRIDGLGQISSSNFLATFFIKGD